MTLNIRWRRVLVFSRLGGQRDGHVLQRFVCIHHVARAGEHRPDPLARVRGNAGIWVCGGLRGRVNCADIGWQVVEWLDILVIGGDGLENVHCSRAIQRRGVGRWSMLLSGVALRSSLYLGIAARAKGFTWRRIWHLRWVQFSWRCRWRAFTPLRRNRKAWFWPRRSMASGLVINGGRSTLINHHYGLQQSARCH